MLWVDNVMEAPGAKDVCKVLNFNWWKINFTCEKGDFIDFNIFIWSHHYFDLIVDLFVSYKH